MRRRLLIPRSSWDVYVSAAETARLTALAEDLRVQLDTLMAEWEEVMMQLEGAVS